MRVDPGALVAGWQQGTVTYLAQSGQFSATVTVDAYRGTVYGVGLCQVTK